MDNQQNIQHRQCVVCGGECSIVANGDDGSTRVENTRLFSIFVRCVSSNNDEIDSNIVSELDSSFNNGNNNGLVFCNTCQSALIQWDKLYESLNVVIPQKLDRIKFTIYAKILNNSDKIDTDTRKHVGDHDESNDGRQSLLFVQKIQGVKDQICRQFNPRVTLNRISDRSDQGKAWKNFPDSVDEDEFEEFYEIQNDDNNDDDFIEDSETKEDSLSVDDEPNDGTEDKRRRKPFVGHNTVSKLIGLGKFLYRDKFVFFQKNNKFECGECSAVTTQRHNMLRHMGHKHMKEQEIQSKETNHTEENGGGTKLLPKLIGPGKFLYGDKYLFFQKNNKFQCAECSAVISRRNHMLRHIRVKHIRMSIRDEEHPRPKASKVGVKADLSPEHEKIVVLALNVGGNDHDSVALTNLFETENNLEELDTISNATENPVLINTCEESEILSTEILPRRSLRERRPAAIPADLAHVDDEASSDQEQDRANAGHDDDWEMASEGSMNDNNNLEVNSVGSSDDGEQVRKRPNVACAKRGESKEKSEREDVKRYELVSSGPNEWTYADKYKIIFNSEEERYYCGLCCAMRSKRAGLVAHIREQHIDGKLTKQTVLRQTGPNEYVYGEKYKITVDKNDDWYCGECGAQRKNRVVMMNHIRKSHIHQRNGPEGFRTFDEVSPNEFLHNDKYSFRFDPDQELYLCSLCDYTSAAARGVVGHIRTNHYTDADKQQHRAVEVGPGEYLYGGRYKILLENGRYRCTLCNRTREVLHALYPHFRTVHPVGSSEPRGPSENPSVPRGKRKCAAQKPKAPEADKTAVPITGTKKERMRQAEERDSLRTAIRKGWKIQGNGKWVYKSNWQVRVENGKYKCLTCDMEDGDRKAAFKHVQSVHAKEPYVVQPSAPVGCDEITELEYEGVPYKYDPIENKYTCGLCDRCNARGGNRRRMIHHIKEKHIDPQKYICDICGQEYDSKVIFRHHRARHEGPKYACAHCGKRFTEDHYLRTHLKIHMGEDAKKHQCEFCGKKFHSLKQLKNHRPSHTGEKPFPCDLCGESFPTTFKRREHRKKLHGGLPQKHGWKPTEGDVAVRPVCSTGEDLTATEMETSTVTLGLCTERTIREPSL